ncbi:PREDICTED: uncharacterized protein LOC109338693 [Lupinus angustifolius]|uniref:uncharacterized protein LOC109338693 n=1 Tax=Lupinus angustifolius TaxID=3871 RepID=UPI00092F15BF|nr:PREDICTED: uncharacterized protein LOC109338693 [Lupinus angustifolius]
MAENTQLKGLESAIREFTAALQQFREESDKRHNNYMHERHLDHARFYRVENQMTLLHASHASGNTSHTDSSSPLPFQIFKAEQFFDYYSTLDNQRLIIDAVHMEKDVVPWFQMLSRTQPFQSWARFTRSLEMEFCPSEFESPRPALLKLTQTSTVAEYYSAFTVLANRVDGLSPEALLNCFISGLIPDIKREVIAQSPLSLSKAVALGKLFEEKYLSTTPKQNEPVTQRPYFFSKPIRPSTLPPLLPTPPIKPTNTTAKSNPIKHITRAEMQLRREKGMCYYYDDKFSLTYKCPNRHYLLLQIENPDDHPQLSETPKPTATDSDLLPVSEYHLSFNALNGSQGAGTMRFQGTIQGIQVSILLDSGISDNFLQPCIAQCLKLPIQDNDQFQVLVDNGNSLTSQDFIADLPITIHGHHLQLPVYLLPITSTDLVLGAPWLKTLGPHIADYNKLSIKFYIQDNFITLYGDKMTGPTQAQFHHINCMQHTHAILASYTLQFQHILPHETTLPPDLHPEIASLLSNFLDLFVEPKGLPPTRFQDHGIPLLEGNNHVKKKDGSWHFCIDYRVLNAITVKDSFPIPTVDELLDELGGTQYFSKLDLHSGYHQILVKPEDRHKTAFRTHNSLYKWLVMPFGLSNAPASFQSLMNAVFQAQLRKSVLGLSGYYLRFIKSYATIASPLTALLNKDSYQWDVSATTTFNNLKAAITVAPKQSAYVRELYAITEAMATFGHYIMGNKFIIRTNHKSLRCLTDQTIQIPEQQKWLHKLLGFDFTIEYKPGSDNVAVDALSRSLFMALSGPANPLLPIIDVAINADPTLALLKQ